MAMNITFVQTVNLWKLPASKLRKFRPLPAAVPPLPVHLLFQVAPLPAAPQQAVGVLQVVVVPAAAGSFNYP